MRGRKERPPVWQQGASRAFIENPSMDPGERRPVSRRRFVIVRTIQALLIAGLMAVICYSGVTRGNQISVGIFFYWAAFFLNFTISMPGRERRPLRLLDVLVLVAIVTWIAGLFLFTGVPVGLSTTALAFWLPYVVLGYGIVVAFAWRFPPNRGARSASTRP